jgi:hypothetical protein
LSTFRITGPYPVATSQDSREYYGVNVEFKEVFREKKSTNYPSTNFRKLEMGLADIPSTPKNDTTKQWKLAPIFFRNRLDVSKCRRMKNKAALLHNGKR